MFWIAVLGVIIYGIYVIFIKPIAYWRNKGICYVNPWKNLVIFIFRFKSPFEGVVDAYRKYPEKRYYGSFQFHKPCLFVHDLELIKRITIKDFEYFPDHMNFLNEKDKSVVSLNLFALQGQRWRDMRSTLSPAFTSSKMRSMYTLIQETAEDFAEYFSGNIEDVIELEMKNVYSRFTNDVIANCAFGIKCDSLKEEMNEFFVMGSNLTKPTGLRITWAILATLFPKCFEFFRIPMFPPDIDHFFRKIVTDTMAFREKENITRPDMIHLLMEARKGRLNHESDKVNEKETGFATVEESSIGKAVSKMEITDDVVTAQALIFFLAGFDTTSTLLSFLSYELALKPDIQTKLQNEIDLALQSGNGKLTYEELLKMNYLDQVVSEALRKYPPGFALSRACVKDYKIEAKLKDEVDLVVEKDCLVLIPVAGIHLDPKYFPEPDKFDPDRFNEENKRNIVPGSYMPFGSGPRNCIGSRFALLEVKALIVSLLSRFEVVPTKRTIIPLKLSRNFSFGVKDGLWLGFKKRVI